MRKQNNADPKDYPFQIAKFRWEFLRRNKNYREDYQKKNTFRKAYWLKEYGVYPPYDPKDDFPKEPNSSTPGIFMFYDLLPAPSIVLKDINSKPIHHKEVMREQDVVLPYLNELSVAKLNQVSTLNLLVDITQRERLILSEFNKLICHWKKMRKTKNKSRFENYRQYLRIFDLKERGWSWTRLANKSHPNEAGGLDYAKQKVMRDYKRCKKLIEGGYRQIK